MKKLILLISVIIFSCSTQKNDSENPIDFIYTPTSLDNFIIGNNENTMIVQEIHKAINNKDFEKAYTYMSDDIIMNNADGSSVEGLENFKSAINQAYSDATFSNYEVFVNISLVAKSNDTEWVILWDKVDISDSNGNTKSENYQEAFRIKDGKVNFINQFAKPDIN